MGGVDDRLARELGVAAGQPADHVRARPAGDRVLEREREAHAERHRPEVASLRRGAQRLEVVASEAGDAPGRVLREPSLHRDDGLAGQRGQGELLAGPGALDDLPPVARGGVRVEDQGCRRAELRRHLELVVPAPVVEPALPGEQLRVRLRLVVQEQEHASAEVRALEVVPALLRGHDPVPDEHDLGRVELRPLRLDAGHGDVVREEAQVLARVSPRDARCLGESGHDAHEVERLLPGTSRNARLEPDGLETRGDEGPGEAVPASARGPSLEQVAPEEPDVGAHPALADGRRRRPFLVRDDGRPDRREAGRSQRGQGAGQQEPHRRVLLNFFLDGSQVTCHIMLRNRASRQDSFLWLGGRHPRRYALSVRGVEQWQ